MEDQEIAEKVQHLSEDELELYQVRHSLAHVMADAVMQLYPGTKLGFGPPVENGFYYDFDLPESLNEDDLPKIEKLMKKIIRQDLEFVRENMTAESGAERIKTMGQPYKEELAEELIKNEVDQISFYTHGSFTDVCEGPHVSRTGKIPKAAFKLDSVAGAYWRGDETNKMLTRIYGLAFLSKEELEEFIRLRRERMRRDHRKLGRELDIFHIDEDVGKGLPLWLPNGTVIREELEKLAKEYEFKYGYVRVATPEITREELYYRSGHLPYYKDSMYPALHVVDEEQLHQCALAIATQRNIEVDTELLAEVSRQLIAEKEARRLSGQLPWDDPDAHLIETFYLKPMNCPHHHRIFKSRPRSYRELPLRLAEFGHNYRFEKSGELSGLLRVRGMVMNDAHLYCSEELVKEEFKKVMQLHLDYYKLLEFSSYYFRLSLSDPENVHKFIPEPELWLAAERLCVEAMEEMDLPFETVRGEAAFYGPKVDVQVRNVVGREETASTNQVDPMAAQESRFDLTFVGQDGRAHRPWVLHRAPLGTHERFIAFLIEHFGGAFPTWLAPIQVRLIPISIEQLDYCFRLKDQLFGNFVRVEVDDSSESFNKKVRNGTTRKIPLLAIVGRQEAADNTVTVRRYTRQNVKLTMGADEFVQMVLAEVRDRVWVR